MAGFYLEPDFIEKLLHPIKPAMRLWTVLASAPRQRLLKLLNQVDLIFAQVNRRFETNTTHQVSRGAAAHGFDAFTAEPKHAPGLRFLRDFECHLTGERRNFNFTPKAGGREADGDFTVEVGAISGEDGMLLDRDLNVKIAGRRTGFSCFPFPRKPNPIAVIDAGRNLDGERLGFLDAALTVTALAGVFDLLSGTATGGTGLLDTEKPCCMRTAP